MKHILLIYGTKEGHTKKIAHTIAEQLRHADFEVDVVDSAFTKEIQIENYDAFIAGASVHLSRYPKAFQSFVHDHSSYLQEKPSAFFSVCLGILETKNKKSQSAERKIVSDFLSNQNWQPSLTSIFAGALLYSKYNWLKRQLMRIISWRADGSTDTSRDYEYTNWNEVSLFTSNFILLITEKSKIHPANNPEIEPTT
jgi:menaquinone-dependent protoporphyrinogen oxidase